MPKKLFQSKFLALSLVFSFILLITTEAFSKKTNVDSKKEFTPVVKVRQQQEIPEVQKRMFKRLIEDGKKLLQEEMDYEGAINKFKEAQGIAITREQKADALFYLSLGYYATLAEKGDKEFNTTIRNLLEIDYYRKLDELLCPPRYVQLFRGIKEEYGALRIYSKPAGADVYINESKDPVGKTPLIIGAKAGTIKIRLKKGKQEKRDTLRIIAGETTTSPTYTLKGKSSLIYVIGGIVLAGGVGAALLGGGKGNGGGAPSTPTTGSIQVNSNPTGAQVYLDGIDTGRTTNATLTNVSPGDHTIKLIKDGYYEYEESVSVTIGQTTTMNANLTEIEAEGGYIFITKWGTQGSGDGQFNMPHSIAIDEAGFAYVPDAGNHRIQKFTTDGTFLTKWGSQGNGNGQFNEPVGIAVDGDGFVYVADAKNNNMQKFTSDGTFVSTWGFQLDSPRGIAVDRDNIFFVLDGNEIKKFTSSGTLITSWGSQGSGEGQFEGSYGIDVDRAGNVYVADINLHRIQKFGPALAIQKITEKTYPSSYNHSINRNLRPRSGLLIRPSMKRLEIKQRLMNGKVSRKEKK